MAPDNKATSNEPFSLANKSLRSSLKNMPNSIIEALTGVIRTDRREVLASLGYMLQRSRNLNFFDVFLQEWAVYRDRGRIKQDCEESDQFRDCLQEMLDFLDKELPNRKRFEVMKRIFMVAATESLSLDRNSQLPHEYMQICRSLSAGATLVLAAVYEGYCEQKLEGREREETANAWLARIAKASGLEHTSLVEQHENGLIEKHLITERKHSDRSGVFIKNNRLTDLGLAFCTYVAAYDNIEKDCGNAPRPDATR